LKILAINTLPNGSTGNIMNQILNKAKEKHEIISYHGNWYKKVNSKYPFSFSFGFYWENKLSAIVSKITGSYRLVSFFGTKKLLREITASKPDVIHLHNLHLWVINIPMLFKYIKKYKIPIIWTLHDCWAFTGHCPHFTMVGCDKWKTGCYKCLQYREYPRSLFDNSKRMYRLKKKWFTGVKDMTIVTPSQWLAELAKQSFLKDYPVKVINNGIDLSVFKPTESDFRKKYGIPENKYLLLGVAFDWGVRKGLDVFIELFKRLPQEQFQIILVGTNKNIDKRLPKGIISIHRTQNQTELAEIYTAADVFINPTREEVLGLVNIESLACGTPVITFDTGGSPECIDETCGAVVPCGDVNALEKEILRVCKQKIYTREDCIKRAKAFDQNEKYEEYVSLYKSFQKE